MADNMKKGKTYVIETCITIVLVISVVFCGSITFQVLMKGYASFGNYSFFRVVTGSMEPTIPTGALLVCEDVDIETINQGDIICFYSKDKNMKKSVITHRVITIAKDAENNITFFTKGDANLSMDGYFTDEANFIGKVSWYTENDSALAGVVKTVSSRTGFLACVVFPVLLISSLILRECTKSIMADLEEANAELDNAEKQREEENKTVSDEEYEEMYARIKAELMEELGIKEE